MRIIIANDHGAVNLKNEIVGYLSSRGHEVNNLGVDCSDSCDYPDMARLAVDEFRKGDYDFGILLCGTGIGISMSANKLKGVRCALPSNIFAAEMSKAHNDANFLAFGGRMQYADKVTDMIQKFIDTKFEGGRHAVRVSKMMALEECED
ncbi:MAG TPA: ribose 5-phosphate isomerase B [Spirochaetota bacterium]